MRLLLISTMLLFGSQKTLSKEHLSPQQVCVGSGSALRTDLMIALNKFSILPTDPGEVCFIPPGTDQAQGEETVRSFLDLFYFEFDLLHNWDTLSGEERRRQRKKWIGQLAGGFGSKRSEPTFGIVVDTELDLDKTLRLNDFEYLLGAMAHTKRNRKLVVVTNTDFLPEPFRSFFLENRDVVFATFAPIDVAVETVREDSRHLFRPPMHAWRIITDKQFQMRRALENWLH